MSRQRTYFMHWKGSPDIAPFLDYLVELGCLRFSGIRKHSLDFHYNDGIEICHISLGTHHWQVEDRQFQLYPGNGFITCPWQRHGNPQGIHERGELAWLILKPRTFTPDGCLDLGSWSRLEPETQQMIGHVLASNTRPVIVPGLPIMDIFRTIDLELVRKQLGYREHINMLLDSLLLRIARYLLTQATKTDTRDDFIARLSSQVHTRLSERISIDELAYSFGMSPSTFSRKVKAHTGFPPADYLLELRLAEARRLLATTQDTITDIATACGFCSSQHFAQLFAKRTGMTPRQFRTNSTH